MNWPVHGTFSFYYHSKLEKRILSMVISDPFLQYDVNTKISQKTRGINLVSTLGLTWLHIVSVQFKLYFQTEQN
jgi:hypothetical protein